MENSEISFKNTLSILNEERNKALSLTGANMLKMMHLIDILSKRVIDAMETPIENVVLIGSTVKVEFIDEDGLGDEVECILNTDFSTDGKISFYDPLGRNILGRSINSIVEYEVGNFCNKVKIVSINNEKEKQKLLTNN